jgi:hypothetical protein
LLREAEYVLATRWLADINRHCVPIPSKRRKAAVTALYISEHWTIQHAILLFDRAITTIFSPCAIEIARSVGVKGEEYEDWYRIAQALRHVVNAETNGSRRGYWDFVHSLTMDVPGGRMLAFDIAATARQALDRCTGLGLAEPVGRDWPDSLRITPLGAKLLEALPAAASRLLPTETWRSWGRLSPEEATSMFEAYARSIAASAPWDAVRMS